MSEYLLFGGPMHGKYVTLPEGVGHVKVQYDPEFGPVQYNPESPDSAEPVKFKTGFYLRRSGSSLEWQPDPH